MVDFNLRHEWVIYNSERSFEQIGLNQGESICSCRFGLNNDPWNLRFYPQGVGKRRKNNPLLRLYREKTGVPIKLEGYLFITSYHGSDDETIEVNTTMQELSSFVNLPLNLSQNWAILNEGDLAVEINVQVTEISISSRPFIVSRVEYEPEEIEQRTVAQTDRAMNMDRSAVTFRNPDPESEVPSDPDKLMATSDCDLFSDLSSLSRDMQTMFEKKDQSDFILKCESAEFRVHKCVLSSRSPIFARMFQHPMTEATENQVTVTDVDACVMEQLLLYMYTGRINAVSYSMARDLYSAADKYAILELKGKCSEFISLCLATPTAIEILILADMHNDALLRSTAISFISEDFDDLNTTDAWLSLLKEHPHLGIEILSFTVTQLKSRKNPK